MKEKKQKTFAKNVLYVWKRREHKNVHILRQDIHEITVYIPLQVTVNV